MDLPRNAFKHALAEGRPQLGLWCAVNDPGVVEMLALCGYDWLLIDCEHSAIDARGALPLMQAAAPHPVSTVVRPTLLDIAEIKTLLDLGAQTLLIPQIQDAEEAALAVAAVTYPPKGIRGVAGLSRATRYGFVADYHRRASDEICLLLQVETVRAAENLDSILAVPGIDGIFVGPADLAASMGHPGQPTHPEVRKMCGDLIRRIRAAGLAAGFLAFDDGFLDEMIAAGSQFTAVGVDSALLRNAALAAAAQWRPKIG